MTVKYNLLNRLRRLVLPLSLFITPLSAHSSEIHHWIGQEGGFFENHQAWVPAQAPEGESTTAIFGQATAQQIGLLGDRTLGELVLANDSQITFRAAGGSLEGERLADRTIFANRVRVEDAFLRFDSGSNDDNADANLQVTESMTVDGKLNILDGASVVTHELNLGTDATLVAPTRGWVTGLDSVTGPSNLTARTLTVGDGVGASLRVNWGGTLDSRIAYVGRDAPLNVDSMGLVKVEGMGVNGAGLWDANTVVVGRNAMGRVSALAGGIVNAEAMAFGTGPDNEPENLGLGIGDVIGVTEDGRHAEMNVDSLVVGVRGQGFFNVGDGGQLNTRTTMLARTPGSEANFDMHATDHTPIAVWTNEHGVAVGGDFEAAGGVASLKVRNRSIAEVGGELLVWPGSSVSIEGGLLAANRMYVHPGGQLTMSEGTLQVGEYEGVELLQPQGTFAPGPHTSTSFVLANFSQRGGSKTALEVGGTEAGQFDRIAVDGSAVIDGTLQLSLVDSFLPSPEDSFSVFSANFLGGAYQNALPGDRVAIANGAGSFLIQYGVQSDFDANEIVLSDFRSKVLGDFDLDGRLTPNDIDLLQLDVVGSQYDLNGDDSISAADREYWVETLAGTHMGDTDLNGSVDFKDFLTLSAGFSTVGGWRQGDFDGNGQVEFADFLALSGNFGETTTNAAAVPEPSASLILWVGMAGVLGYRRKRA